MARSRRALLPNARREPRLSVLGVGPPAPLLTAKLMRMAEKTWCVYLSGEIHSDWRERIETGVREAGLPLEISAPVTDHAASDDAGTGTLGEESIPFWHD